MKKVITKLFGFNPERLTKKGLFKKINLPVPIRRILEKRYRNASCIKMGEKSFYYINPNVEYNSIVYSAGISENASFELDLIKHFNVKVFAFDPTNVSEKYTKSIKNKNFIFLKKGVAIKKGNYVIDKKFSLPCISLSEFARKHNHKKLSILKLDVEGYEYGVLDDIFSSNLEIKQIVLEFHGWLEGIPKKMDKIYRKKIEGEGYRLIYKDLDNYTFIKDEKYPKGFWSESHT